MGLIRLVLFLILFLVSSINLVAYYRKKGRDKVVSAERAKALVSHRSLDGEEAAALSKLYKREINYGTPVYHLTGEYVNHSLSTNNQTSDETHTIGGVLVQPHRGIHDVLPTARKVEVIELENKKGALVVSINDDITARSEVKIQEAMEEGGNYSQSSDGGDSFSVRKGRILSEEEMYYLTSDIRPLVNLAIGALLSVPVFIPNIYVGLGAVIPALILFLLFYLPEQSRKKTVPRESQIFEGTLTLLDTTFMMNRFSLSLPPGEDCLAPGKRVMIEGVTTGKESNLVSVLSVDGKSVFPRKKKLDRFIMAAAMGAFLLFILLVGAEVPRKISSFAGYLKTRELQVRFDDYEEFKAYPFEKNQYIEVIRPYALPNVGGYRYGSGMFLTFPGERDSVDFSSVYSRLESLNALQETEEFLNFYIYTINDYETYLYYIDNFYEKGNAVPLSDFREELGDNRYFPLLEEVVYVLMNLDPDVEPEDPIPYPEGGVLKEYFTIDGDADRDLSYLAEQVEGIHSLFLKEEARRMEELIREAEESYLETKEFYIIHGGYTPYLGIDPYYRDLSKFTTRSQFNSKPLYREDMVQAYAMLETLESDIAGASGEQESFSGIIRFTGSADDYERPYLNLDMGEDYEDALANGVQSGLFFLLLAFTLFAVYVLVREELRKQAQSGESLR